MLLRSARKRLISLRRAFGQTRLARPVTRWRRAQLKIPHATPPNAAFLPRFAGEAALPMGIRDEHLLTEAVSWAERKAATAALDSSAKQGVSGRRSHEVPPGQPITNVLFVSHCDFTGNSAVHVYRIALELHGRGLSPVIAVPEEAESVEDVGSPPFPVLTYRDVRRGRLRFPDGRGPDLVHAFTPRERVRKLTAWIMRTYGCPYVVHLEDNDAAILSADLGGTNIDELERLPASVLDGIIRASQVHPLRGARFLERAAGVTVVTERLLELAPQGLPGKIVSPGFDEAVISPPRSREDMRAELGLGPDDFAVVYTGSIHATNRNDMRSLYAALAELRRDGHPVVLVKTGWNSPEAADLPQLDGEIRNLGWVPRATLHSLLGAADALVQPGAPGSFNDYRFPSKLPDFLASGKPVILPRANVGLSLRDGHEAIVLQGGTSAEIYRAVDLVRTDPVLAARIGEQGRAFALRELRWSTSVDSVELLYQQVAAEPPAEPGWALDLDPPVKVVTLLVEAPAATEARVARAHGIYGFCFPIEAAVTPGQAQTTWDFPFCFRIRHSDDETIQSALSELSNPAYIGVLGAPLLIADDPTAAARWRTAAEELAGGPVHFALVDRSRDGVPSERGFDSIVEAPNGTASIDLLNAAMRTRLAVSLPGHDWFRSIAYSAEGSASRLVYVTWMRKLVLQTLCRASAQEPLIFVDPQAAWTERRSRGAWLKNTRVALRDGVQQFYASRGLDVAARRIQDTLRMQ